MGVQSGGGGGSSNGTDTNSYFIDAWIEVPKSVETVSSSALTSAGTWNNSATAPAFTTKPTTNVAGGVVRDNSDLPDNSTTSTTRNYHHFKRLFTVGESGVTASAWDYMGQWNHSGGTSSSDTYLINAYLRIGAGDIPLATALTSAGTWDHATKQFTTKPTENILDGVIYDDKDLPAVASRTSQYDYWKFSRYFTVGESGVAASEWSLIGKVDQDPSGGSMAGLKLVVQLLQQ